MDEELRKSGVKHERSDPYEYAPIRVRLGKARKSDGSW